MQGKPLNRFGIALLFSWLTAIVSLDAQWTCGFDRMHQQRMAEDPEYRNRVAQLEAQLYERSKAYYGNGVKSRSKPNYILPVVVHLVFPPGTLIGQGNHLTDLQVEQGLQYLNQAFANQGPFQTAKGVDAGIQFCLARRDPSGMPTNGITRTESALVNDPMCAPGTDASSDGAIKQLANWDCRRYVNIWLVTDLFNANFGCGLAGYAYFPGAPCTVDGIVQESRYWNTIGGTRITAHEMGHYLSLNHTFNGGCTNADCLLDGDRVCDTPPDNSPSFAPCNTNSCNTDLPDLPDDDSNYMDYSGCGPVHFTDGQRVRMIAGLENGRASLINSNACLPPGDYDVALIQLQTGPDLCVDSLCIQLTIRNDGLKSFSAIPVDYFVDGLAQPVYNWSGILNPGQTALISLPCIPVAPGMHDLDVRLGDPDNQSDFYLSNNNRKIQFEIYPLLYLSLDSLTPTHCISDGTIAVKASGGTAPYTYRISNHAYAQTDPYFQLLVPGRYTVTVTDTHQCIQTLIVDVPDSCQDVSNKRFITNRDARSLGNDCYLLTEALNFQSGSVWYEDKVDLRKSFDIYFDLNLGCIDGAGADGLAFVFQPISTSIGVAGGGLGYQNIMPSLAVEFDSWENNNFADPAFDHLAIMRNGNVSHGTPDNLAGPVGILPGNGNVEDCRFHKALIRWNANEQLLMVYVDCNLRLSYRGDVIQTVFNNDPLVYFGFTAATGSAVNVQQICLNYISGVTKLDDQTICEGGSIQVSAAPKFSRYRWSPANGVSNVDIQNPIFKPDSTTTYFIRYEDNCGFAYQDSFTLFVKKVDLDYELQLLDSCGNFSGALLRLKTDPLDTTGLFAFNGTRFSKDSVFEIAEPGRYTIYRKLGSCIVSEIIDVNGFKNRLRDSLIWIQGLDCRDSGRVVVQALEGIPPYAYRIDGGSWQNSGVFGGLAPGNHLLEIRDQTSCAIQRSVDIARFVNQLDLKIDSSKLELSCCQPDAYIRVNASGSWPFYYYSLDQQSWSSDGYYGALTPGTHRIVARDEFGCSSDTLQFEVRDFRGVSIDTQRLRICKGEFVQVGPVRYDSTGQYEYTFSNRYCCDSIIRTELIVDPVY
ncbi:MAG TPA: M43 family zinc metalloprotease, partial [Saprospiraceae bacterium]|nr:M43 family zinc metalloprotease [Saprospiraceae bacterium]